MTRMIGPIVCAATVAMNVPGMMQGLWYSWASGVFCILMFLITMNMALRD